MKWVALVLMASASGLVGCQEPMRLVGVDNVRAIRSPATVSADRMSASEREIKVYSAALTGDQQVPPTGSTASGSARIQIMNDGSIRWSLRTTGLDSVFAA